jgi:hypothetical protein
VRTDDGEVAEIQSPASTSRRRAIVLFCAGFIAVQIVVPIYRLALPPNQPFGWQMYSSVAGYRYEVKLADGTTSEADPVDYVLRYRTEIDFRDHLPPVLCREFPGATKVVTSNRLLGDKESYSCER